MQAAYLDFVTAIVLRKNSITGVLYRDDPTILAWDIANEPSNPGDETGDILQVGLHAKGCQTSVGAIRHLIACIWCTSQGCPDRLCCLVLYVVVKVCAVQLDDSLSAGWPAPP